MGITLSSPSTQAYTDVPPDVLTSVDPRLYLTSAAITGANRAQLVRVTAKKSGFLRDVIVAFAITSGGTYDLGIYDTGETTPAVRTRLGSMGSTAVPAAETGGAKTTVKWDPGAGVIPIVAGRQYDLAVSVSDVTATLYRIVNVQVSLLPDAYWSVAGGTAQALPKITTTAITSHPLPATFAEASVISANQYMPFIAGRISPT